MAASAPASLPYTGDAEADELIARDPFALLVGFVLDQQVTVQKAFSGPLELTRRLGHLDPEQIAGMEPGALEDVFRERPAIHRFPGTMAARVQALSVYLTEVYDGHAARVWLAADSGADLRKRLAELPGIGDMKVRTIMALLAKQYGVRPPGIEEQLPSFPTLGDVTSAQELADYQAAKRAHKAARRAAAAEG